MRFRVPEIFLGVFLTVAVFAIGMTLSPSIFPPNQTREADSHGNQPKEKSPKIGDSESADDRIAKYTLWLAILTGGLVAVSAFQGYFLIRSDRTARITAEATGKMAEVAERQQRSIEIGRAEQARETQILQRAYLSVVPLGIEQFTDGSDRCSCTVGFRNSGNLPARNVRWFLDWAISGDAKLATFPIDDTKLVGNILITQGATAPKGTRYIPLDQMKKPEVGAPERWLFVWGRIRYQDGFGNERFTDFCHRYNLGALRGGKILAETARYHEYGNRTDD